MISKISSLSVTLFAASFFIVSGCDKKTTVPSETQVPPVTQEQTPMANNAPSSLLNPRNATEKAPEVYKVKFATTKGDFILEVHRSWAPYGADRFYNLVKLGFYNDVVFFRVIDGFMAQTGDVENGNMENNFNLRRAGTGGSDLPDLPAEFSRIPHDRGTLGAARSQNPNSANSQFFINFSNNHFLNGQYTVYGRVISGMEHVDKITRGEPPANPDRMITVRVAADVA